VIVIEVEVPSPTAAAYLRTTTEVSIAAVTAEEPLNEVPVRPVPSVRALVVLAVIVVEPPRATVFPFTVTEVLVRATVEPDTVMPVPAPTARPEELVLKPEFAGRRIAAPEGPVCKPPDDVGLKKKLFPLRATPLEAVYVPAPEN